MGTSSRSSGGRTNTSISSSSSISSGSGARTSTVPLGGSARVLTRIAWAAARSRCEGSQ
jgi:hypothetical protein